jgi:hypothetical protein
MRDLPAWHLIISPESELSHLLLAPSMIVRLRHLARSDEGPENASAAHYGIKLGWL